MSELTTKRTLVKSPPELWAEVSDLEALAKHLGEFGEIRITRLEPETTVVWEGDRVSGTVKLEPSGWGTKVTLTAELAAIEEASEPEIAEPEPVVEEPVVVEEPIIEEQAVEKPVAIDPPASPVTEEPRRGFWARLFGRREKVVAEAPPVEEPVEEPVREPEPEPVPVEEPPAPPLQPVPDPEPDPDEPLPAAEEGVAPLDDDRTVAVLTEVLDNLGAAHHRPFSRG
jgi:hypothetical protein